MTQAAEPAPPAGAPPQRGTLRSWLQLMRFPAVFTAMTDIMAGFALQRQSFEPVPELLWLMAASAGLYLSGMVFNDIFDLAIDREQRPGRPLPSGQISTKQATALAAGLMAAGLGAAAIASLPSLLVAVVLAVCILLYDGMLKKTFLGPWTMGACRTLNLLLGASGGFLLSESFGESARPALLPAIALGIYVAGITWFARTEEKISERSSLAFGTVIVNLGLLLLAASLYGTLGPWSPEWSPSVRPGVMSLIVIMILFTLDRRLFPAINQPTPAAVQGAVKLMLLSIISIDAVLVLAATANVWLTAITILCMLPALIIGRWLYVT